MTTGSSCDINGLGTDTVSYDPIACDVQYVDASCTTNSILDRGGCWGHIVSTPDNFCTDDGSMFVCPKDTNCTLHDVVFGLNSSPLYPAVSLVCFASLRFTRVPTLLPTGYPTNSPTWMRLPTMTKGISNVLAVIIHDIKIPSIINPLNSFFGDYVFFLANVGRDRITGNPGKECIVYISQDDYNKGGYQSQYMIIYYQDLNDITAHTSMTFASNGTIAVLGDDGHVEVVTVEGVWNSTTSTHSYFRSETAFVGVSTILFTNDTAIAFIVSNHTMFNVPFFQYSLNETLTMNINPTAAPTF